MIDRIPFKELNINFQFKGRTEHGANTQGIVSLAGGTTVHFKLDTSTGQLKLKVND